MPNPLSEGTVAPVERQPVKLARAYGWLAILLVVFAVLRVWQLELDAPTIDDVDESRWVGPTDEFRAYAERIDATAIVARVDALAETAG